MKNSIGTSVIVTLFGESHGPAIGAVIDGLAPGIKTDTDFIASQLALRRPTGRISTARSEEDDFRIISGVFEGYTNGAPLCIIIPNREQRSEDYTEFRGPARPGHADYTAYEKYHGFEDYRGGGHFSGRLTAALVAAGGIVIPALRDKGISIGTHIARLGGIDDAGIGTCTEEITENIRRLCTKSFAVVDDNKASVMIKAIEDAAADGDSIGGILETAVTGIPAGLGEPWFDTMEGLISHALFSIPGIKGVQFGGGFDLADARGSEYNDPLRIEEGRVVTASNNNGGINGGITNGMPVIFRCAVKPTPSIHKEQQTVDMNKGEETLLSIKGRHDPAIIHRARIVADSVTALVLADILAQRYGTDWLSGIK